MDITNEVLRALKKCLGRLEYPQASISECFVVKAVDDWIDCVVDEKEPHQEVMHDKVRLICAQKPRYG